MTLTSHSRSATEWRQEVTLYCLLLRPKWVNIQHLLYQSASGDTVTAAACPEWRGGARARSTLLAALIIIIFFRDFKRIFGGFNIFENSPNLACTFVLVKIFLTF